jgi:hypothetical protein
MLLFAAIFIFAFLLGIIISFSPVVFHPPFFLRFLDLILPVVVQQLIVTDDRSKYLFKFTLEDTVAKIILLKFRHLLNLFLKFLVFEADLLLI